MPDRRVSRVWALVHTLAEAEATQPALRHVCVACTQLLRAACAAVSVSNMSGPLEPLFGTDTRGEELEELQYTLGHGPSVDADEANRPVLVPDLTDSAAAVRWPIFASAAVARRVRGMFAFPVAIGAARVGVLGVYRDESGPLSTTELADGLACADTVLQLALDDRAGIVHDVGHPGYLDLADRRAEVHQAAGMVSVQLGLHVTDALARVRAYAYVHDRRLVDVAADVVARRLRFPTDDGSEAEPTRGDDTNPEEWA
jgi:hypothetical protein